jgi:hypothetical protein
MGFLPILTIRSAFDCETDILKEGIHADIYTIDRPHNDGAVLELNRDSLVFELHKELDKLHAFKRELIICIDQYGLESLNRIVQKWAFRWV